MGTVVALERRLFGCGKRVHWSERDIELIARYYGVSDTAGLVNREYHAPPLPETGSIVKTADTGKLYTFTASSGVVDRSGDVINPLGWDLSSFVRNPVLLWSHDASSLPIGRVVRIGLEGMKLKATASFANTQFAQRVRALVDDRILHAVSVGFLPTDWTFDHKRDGVNFNKQSLLELSVVNVPANPEALIETIGSKSVAERDRARARRERDLDVMRLRVSP